MHSAGQMSDVTLPDADVARGVEGEVGAGVETRELRGGLATEHPYKGHININWTF